MAVLKKDVITDTLSEVRVHYLSSEISKWWNARRSPEDLNTFCGWYWVRGTEEAGPFRTRSAALRDAYYQFVLHQNLPKMWTKKVPSRLVAGTEMTVKPRAKPRAKTKRKVSSVEARATS